MVCVTGVLDRGQGWVRGLKSLERLDSELARLARSSGMLRVTLGDGLEALARGGGHHELGFATVEGYALERCERSARWVQESRWLSRRLAELQGVRRAVARGEISYSMAQVLAKAADTKDEDEWLLAARQRTVRAMRELVKERAAEAARRAETGQLSAVDAMGDEERVTLTVTVDREDAWLFEAARMMVKRVAGGTLEETMEALLGEGTTSLLSGVERADIVPFDEATDEDEPQRAWERELARYREEAEVHCEGRLDTRNDVESEGAEVDWDGGTEQIDSELRRVAAELARRDLLLGEVAEAFWSRDGWRRLGYGTAAQYARERLGMSLSSVKAKRALARRARSMPRLRKAVNGRELGFEAARLVAAVASRETADAWVTRARERTVKHLREEVDAAEMLGRLGIEPGRRPPDEATMAELGAIERRVVSGAVFGTDCAADAAGREQDAAGATGREEQGQLSAGALARAERDARERSRGRVTLKVRVATGIRRYYRWLERMFQRRGPRGVTFVRYLCVALIDPWRPKAQPEFAYADVYERDGHRCTSPVCTRQDLTPHHLVFRSAGGDDTADNLTSLCVWCHLDGVHGGTLTVTPPASAMMWQVGRTPHTVVEGRRRVTH